MLDIQKILNSFKRVIYGTAFYFSSLLAIEEYAYVTNHGDGTLSIIRIPENVVLGPIPVGSGPIGVAATVDGKYVYVVNNDDATVSVIQIFDYSVLDYSVSAIPLNLSGAVAPRGAAITPNGKQLYVADDGSDNVFVIDTSDYAVTSISVPGAAFWDVAITSDGSKAYVTNSASGNVIVINTEDNSLAPESPITVGSAPTGVAITPDGSRVFVSNTGGINTSVSMIDTTDNNSVTSIDLLNLTFRPEGIDITPDGKYVYVAESNGNEVGFIIIPNTSFVSPNITSADFNNPLDVAISSDGKYAYVVNGTTLGTISVIRVSDNTIIEPAIPVGNGPICITIPRKKIIPPSPTPSLVLTLEQILEKYSSVRVQK